MKTYRGPDAKENYENEVKAFKLLHQPISRGIRIIRCYGGYVQNDQYHIIEEYADRGTLEHFFQNTEPPLTSEDFINFWTAMFELIKAVHAIHHVHQIDSTGTPLNGFVLYSSSSCFFANISDQVASGHQTSKYSRLRSRN